MGLFRKKSEEAWKEKESAAEKKIEDYQKRLQEINTDAITTTHIASGEITADKIWNTTTSGTTSSYHGYNEVNWNPEAWAYNKYVKGYKPTYELPEGAAVPDPPTPEEALRVLMEAFQISFEGEHSDSEREHIQVQLLCAIVEGDFPEEAQAHAKIMLGDFGYKSDLCPRCENHVQAKNDYLCRFCR